MAAAADDIQIDLDLAAEPKDAPKEDKPKIEITEEAAPKQAQLTPDEGMEKLRAQLEAEKSARIAAETRAREASEAELKARTEVHGSQLDVVTSGISTAKQNVESLKSQFADALASQDYTKAAELQAMMSENQAKLSMMEEGKKRLESAPKPTLRVPEDPVEQFVQRLTPLSAQWVREHPEFVRDPVKNTKMMAAHSLAVADGHPPDSPGYFDAINETLRLSPARQVTLDDDPMKHAAQEVRRAPPAAAPVSRSSNGTSRPNAYRASALEKEAAELSGITLEEYVNNREVLRKEGRYN
jgi:hypothetical protein